jgi:hypothetical protein
MIGTSRRDRVGKGVIEGMALDLSGSRRRSGSTAERFSSTPFVWRYTESRGSIQDDRCQE